MWITDRQIFRLSRLRLEKWQTETTMCQFGRSEETAEQFFLACGPYHDTRLEDIDSLNLLDPEECNTIVDYISHIPKLKGIV